MSEEKVSLVGRVRHFFSSGLWTHELRPGTIAAAGIRLLQLTVVIAEGFVRHQLLLRTGALTYITVLSMIPLVAMVLSVLKALGVSGNIAEYVVEVFDRCVEGQPKIFIFARGLVTFILCHS